jgi:ketol-acid reductoisomerase
MAHVFSEADADLRSIISRRIAIIEYGNQGRARSKRSGLVSDR